ncbi:hypothetical protein [Nitrosospira sp. NRS527]|uniref:hypothetical protein n=1 Tax=Nitrosospira sp. NRS527 TaxID=155925 RepID=UPI001AF0A403|nr:hypothetical protein [Nitrosospira sp. NRS527]BCT66942.1 hypothetical protein NNRS527_00517 [Nitrosospira sp. NRS527]
MSASADISLMGLSVPEAGKNMATAGFPSFPRETTGQTAAPALPHTGLLAVLVSSAAQRGIIAYYYPLSGCLRCPGVAGDALSGAIRESLTVFVM